MSAILLDDVWQLTPADRLLVQAKRWGNRLRFAIMGSLQESDRCVR